EVTVLGQVRMEGCALVEVRAVLDTEIHDDIAGDRGALPGADRYGHRRLSAVEPTEPSGGRVRRGDIEPMVVGARSRRSEQHDEDEPSVPSAHACLLIRRRPRAAR